MRIRETVKIDGGLHGGTVEVRERDLAEGEEVPEGAEVVEAVADSDKGSGKDEGK